MLLVEEEAAFTPEDTGAGGATDEISNRIPANRCNRQRRRQRQDVEISLCREQTCRHQQRIAREKHADQQARLRKNDCCQSEQSRPLHEIRKIRDAMEKVGERLHRAGLESKEWKRDVQVHRPRRAKQPLENGCLPFPSETRAAYVGASAELNEFLPRSQLESWSCSPWDGRGR